MLVTPRSRRRAGVMTGAGMAALIGSAVFAAPASAHSPQASYSCDAVTVQAHSYDRNQRNTIQVTADGATLLDEAFGSDYPAQGSRTLPLPEHSAPITVHVVIKAGNRHPQAGWNLDETRTVAPCEQPTTTPPTATATTPVPPTATATTPSDTPPPVPTTSAPTAASHAPVVLASTSPAAGDLAETGAPGSAPMIAGVAAAVVAAGAGLVLFHRRRTAAAHR